MSERTIVDVQIGGTEVSDRRDLANSWSPAPIAMRSRRETPNRLKVCLAVLRGYKVPNHAGAPLPGHMRAIVPKQERLGGLAAIVDVAVSREIGRMPGLAHCRRPGPPNGWRVQHGSPLPHP
ncbi:hypothetical protein MES4922_20330 [Mesorhizobium ventifaucium]|uniref:Uncharacterized protein n=1 Tax=Mesorhizobium ventifaucium TaxID=666020 RepID=A0ABN8JL67_9HYPH|nr:hypothetical protein MES4922_20330 [Mesorhizobium ventifaucium]